MPKVYFGNVAVKCTMDDLADTVRAAQANVVAKETIINAFMSYDPDNPLHTHIYVRAFHKGKEPIIMVGIPKIKLQKYFPKVVDPLKPTTHQNLSLNIRSGVLVLNQEEQKLGKHGNSADNPGLYTQLEVGKGEYHIVCTKGLEKHYRFLECREYSLIYKFPALIVPGVSITTQIDGPTLV